jgi:hypothetical protein
MDVYDGPKKILEKSRVKEKIEQKFDEAESLGLNFFTVIFHDLYFDPAYVNYRDWYKTLIECAIKRKYQFTTFKKAITELKNESA